MLNVCIILKLDIARYAAKKSTQITKIIKFELNYFSIFKY